MVELFRNCFVYEHTEGGAFSQGVPSTVGRGVIACGILEEGYGECDRLIVLSGNIFLGLNIKVRLK